MTIMLGNLSVKDIENRLGIELSEEHRQELTNTHQDKVNDTPLEDGHWHCYDIPFMLMCDVKETAMKFRDIFSQYKFTKSVTFQLGWER